MTKTTFGPQEDEAMHHNDVIKKLSELFPKTFFENSRLRQPIKKGIAADIERMNLPELDGLDVLGAVDYYTGHYGYWKTTSVAGSRRLDLDGNPVDTVTASEAQSAINKIHEFNARKGAMGHFNPHDLPPRNMGSVMERRINGIATARPSAPSQSDDQLVSAAMKKLTRAQAMLAGDDSDGLRSMVVRPLLESAAEDLRSLIARVG
jgi:sRNA-binding protein